MSISNAHGISSVVMRRRPRRCRSRAAMPSSPANSVGRGRLALGILAVAALAPLPAAAQLEGNPSEDVAAIHDRCVDLARSKPQEALDRAQLWKSQGGGFAAEH